MWYLICIHVCIDTITCIAVCVCVCVQRFTVVDYLDIC